MSLPNRRPVVELLEGRALLSAVHGQGKAESPRVEIYRITFAPINGSGISGQGTLKVTVQNSFGSDPATLTLKVKGLERGKAHAVDLEGFVYLLQKTAARPPGSAAGDDSSPAGLGGSIISKSEGRPFYGDPQSSGPIRSIPATRKAGSQDFTTSFRVNYDLRSTPAKQAIVLRGLSVAGQYQPTVPVAFGSIKLIRSGHV